MKSYKLKTPISEISELIEGEYYVCNENDSILKSIIQFSHIEGSFIHIIKGKWLAHLTNISLDIPYSELDYLLKIRIANENEINEYFK